MIDSSVIVGRTRGMESVVAETLAISRAAEYFATLRDFLQMEETPPDFLLVLQHWPDEFLTEEIEQLFIKFPLTRIICCYGPWCASMGRTRSQWPDAVRVATADYLSRLTLEVRVIHGEIPPLPVTAGLDELFGYLVSRSES